MMTTTLEDRFIEIKKALHEPVDSPLWVFPGDTSSPIGAGSLVKKRNSLEPKIKSLEQKNKGLEQQNKKLAEKNKDLEQQIKSLEQEKENL